jgi:hypothetical protein
VSIENTYGTIKLKVMDYGSMGLLYSRPLEICYWGTKGLWDNVIVLQTLAIFDSRKGLQDCKAMGYGIDQWVYCILGLRNYVTWKQRVC